MSEDHFLDSLQDLTGQVAIVTGGAAGIGLETTVYLARKGAKVYVASRNIEKSERGISEARSRLNGQGGEILFHHLDLSSITGATKSANRFQQIETRLDIIVCNAGICMTSAGSLSDDGYESMFATNHLGHFAFVTALLDLLEDTASSCGEARVVVTSSVAYQMASRLDYSNLMVPVENDKSKLRDLNASFARYGRSKLANIYFAAELDRRLRGKGIKNIYVNSCHPGMVSRTGLGGKGALSPIAESAVRKLLAIFSNTVEDAAKTQVHLAAGRQISDEEVHGQFWEPQCSWTRAYTGCRKHELPALARDVGEELRLWEYSEAAVHDVVG
ncbi:MAG: hypothetical protein M1825_003321 [Sarcosagium campestre]|nr:MAG: hypothetical protein M1825_003321 [Sarcosagium campestre]